MIHPTAIIDPSARIDDDVEIGPYCVVGRDVAEKLDESVREKYLAQFQLD